MELRRRHSPRIWHRRRAMSGNYPQPSEKDPIRLCRAIRDLYEGRSNAMGQFTIAINQATTVVSAPNCGLESRILLTPRTANAAAELGAGTMYVSAVAPGAFTVTHANNATAGRTFDYAIQG